MPREKPNYREMLGFLHENGYGLVYNKKEVAALLNISVTYLEKLIQTKEIRIVNGNKITIGELARFLC